MVIGVTIATNVPIHSTLSPIPDFVGNEPHGGWQELGWTVKPQRMGDIIKPEREKHLKFATLRVEYVDSRNKFPWSPDLSLYTPPINDGVIRPFWEQPTTFRLFNAENVKSRPTQATDVVAYGLRYGPHVISEDTRTGTLTKAHVGAP
jgi:hypothetical protein